jgi:hypothetical protein
MAEVVAPYQVFEKRKTFTCPGPQLQLDPSDETPTKGEDLSRRVSSVSAIGVCE